MLSSLLGTRSSPSSTMDLTPSQNTTNEAQELKHLTDFKLNSEHGSYAVTSTSFTEHQSEKSDLLADITITERTNRILRLFSKYKVKINKNVWENLESDGTRRTVKVRTASKREFTYNLKITKDCNCLGRKKLVVYFTADTTRPDEKSKRQEWEAVGSKLKKDLNKQFNNKKELFDNVWQNTTDIRNRELKTWTQRDYLSNNTTRPSRAASVRSGFLSGLKNFVLTPSVVLLVTPLAPLHPLLYMIGNTDPNPHDHEEIGFKKDLYLPLRSIEE